jgi:uncharacterized protein with beta-barrel porin domain
MTNTPSTFSGWNNQHPPGPPPPPHSRLAWHQALSGIPCLLGLAALPMAGSADGFASLPGLTPYQQSLGAALDQSCGIAGGALADRCRQLESLDTAAQKQAIVQLTPFQFLPQSGMPIKLRIAQVDTRARLAALRRGESSPYALTIDGRTLSAPPNGGGSGDGDFRDGPLGLFVQGKFQTGSKDRERSSFDFDTYGIAMGADYRFTDRLTMGLSTGYTHTDTWMTQNSGDMETNAPHGTFFGNYYLPEDFYVDWAATYTGFDNDLRRKFAYPGFNGLATSQPDADLYGIAVSLGKDFSLKEWLFSPYVRFEYANLHLDAYRERGGNGLNYEVAPQSYESFISIPGLQASYAFSLPWGILTPSLRFEWEHQFENDNRPIGIRLADAPAGTGNFFLPTGRPDRDYFNLGGTVTAAFPGGGAAFLRYEARLAQQPLTSHSVELGFRIPF